MADPELTRRGLRAGFGVIVGKCDAPHGGTWAQVRALAEHRHDVFSHSFGHPCLTKNAALAEACDPAAPRSVDYDHELGEARAVLVAKMGASHDFFIFPYDVCDSAAIAYLKAKGYLGARCGGFGTNAGGPRDPFAVEFDVFGPSYSEYFARGPCRATDAGAAPVQWTTRPAEYSEACRRFVLDHYVDDVIAAGGWGVREFHGLDPIDTSGWETVNLADYRAHLDNVAQKARAGTLWVEAPTTVLRYTLARDVAACALPTSAPPGALHFAPPSARCARVATTLTYRVATVDGSDPAALVATQGGERRPTKRVSAGHYLIDADPTKGDMVVTRGGA